MAQVTKHFTENSGSNRSVWSLRANGTDVIASADTVTVQVPTINASYQYSGKQYAGIRVFDTILQIGSQKSKVTYNASFQKWASTAQKTLSRSTTSVSLATNDLFNSSNKTSKTVSVYLNSNASQYEGHIYADSSKDLALMEVEGSLDTFCGLWGPLATVTLNAPPTFSTTQVSLNTSQAYAGKTTASVTVSSLSAKYGGDIRSAVLKIGNQTTSRSTNGTLSIVLNTAGTFTPTVTVSDSRGQTTTKTLTSITVKSRTVPSIVFSVERTTRTGVPLSDGKNAVISATLNWDDAFGLAAPTVNVADGNNNTIACTKTWYKNRSSSGALSSPISDWSAITQSDMPIYCLLSTDIFNSDYAYTIRVMPNDSEGGGTEQTQTLSGAFYTVDFLAGGKGIAFGKIAENEGFECDMDTQFNGEVDVYVDNSKVNINNRLRELSIDCITEQGVKSGWTYRKWKSGKIEAWYSYTGAAATYAVWVSPLRFRDISFAIPSGIFSGAPNVVAGSPNNQLWVVSVGATSATNINARFATVSSGSITTSCRLYCFTL